LPNELPAQLSSFETVPLFGATTPQVPKHKASRLWLIDSV